MPILFVQSQQSNSTSTNIAATFTRTPIAGNLLVAYYAANSGNITPTLTGWTAMTFAGTGTNAVSELMFYKIAGSSESATVTTTSATATASLVILEYSGVDQINPLLIQNSALTPTASTTYTTPSVTPTTGNEALVIAAVMQKQNSNTAFAAQKINNSATGVSIRSNPTSLIKQDATVFDLFVPSTSGSYVGTATQATSLNGAGAIAIFKAAPIPGKSLAYESWDGTNGAAWPSQWSTITNATDGTATIQGNLGQITSSTTGFASGGRKLTSVSSVNQRLLLDFSIVSNSEHYMYIGMRSSGAFTTSGFGTEYYFNLFLPATSLEIGTHQGTGAESKLTDVTLTGGSPTATVHVDASIIGSQMTVYAWTGSNTKPSTPSYTVTNTTITAAGTVMLYQANGAAGTARSSTFDNMYLTTGLALSNTTAPAISGTATPSSVMTVSNGSWSATPDSYLYQWYRDGIAISGATASTYTYTATDTGTALTAYVQAVKAEYATGGAFSNSVTGSATPLTNTALPTITGTTTVGNVLTATNGTWSQTPDSYTYQWNRSGVAISGATSQTYTIVSADAGVPVTVTVTAIKATYTNGTATSAAVTPTSASALSNTVLPAISGSAIVGQNVTVSNGTWSQTPTSYTYQWNRDGVAISGATSQTYIYNVYDQGLPITATVTAIKAGSTNGVATSAAATPLAATVTDRLAGWRASLTNRATSPATITVMGGGSTEGQGATARLSRWSSRLRDALRRNYRTTGAIGGEGYQAAWNNVAPPDSYWTRWNSAATGTVNFYGWAANLGYRLVAMNASSSITYPFTGTDIDIWYTTGGGGFTYSIDGGASTHVDASAAYYTSAIASATGLTAGDHSITITSDSGGEMDISGFFIYNGDKNKGIRLADASQTYQSIDAYNIDQPHFIGALQATKATLYILEFGLADATDTTPANFVKKLQNFINALQAAYIYGSGTTPPSILILASYTPKTTLVNSFQAPWSQYVSAMQTVATNSQVGFLDLSAVMPQADTSGAGYYSTDGIYPNDFGHSKIADLIFTAITDQNASYNTALSNWYTALTKRASTPAKWFAIGDSITEGQGASTIDKRWVTLTHKLLQANYPVLNVGGGVGFKPGRYSTYPPDSTWTDWYSASSGNFYQSDAGAGPGYRLTYIDVGASRTYPFYGTDIDVWVYNGGGTLTYQIDGGTTQTVVTPNNGATTISSKTGLTRGNHTITVSTPNGVSITGFMIYDGDKNKGVQLYESAHSGATTGLFLSDLTNFINNVTVVGPDLITVEIGVNDTSADSVSTVMNHVLNLAGSLSDIAKLPSIAIIAPYQEANMTPVSSFSQYIEAWRMIAQAVGAAFIDFSSFLPVATTTGTGYYSTDGQHPNDTGHQYIANTIITKLADTRITPASAGTVLATETWTLPNGSAWPTQWSVTINSGGTIDVQNSMGHIASAAAAWTVPGNTYLTGMPAVTDTEILMDFTIPDATIEQYPLIASRVQSASWQANGDPATGYLFNVYPATGSIEVVLSSSFTSVKIAPYAVSSGVTYTVRWQMIGNATKVRIWPKSGTEPSTWNIDTTGVNDLTPGRICVYTENGGSSNAAVMYYDNLTVIAPVPIASKVYIGNKVAPMGYVGSHPIVSVYVGNNKVI